MGIAITGVGSSYQPPEHMVDQSPSRTGTAYRAQEAESARAAAVSDIDATMKDLERISLAFNKQLRFSVNRETDEVIVKVIDPATDKVIKELPPEELQRLHQRLKEMIGLLFDEKV